MFVNKNTSLSISFYFNPVLHVVPQADEICLTLPTSTAAHVGFGGAMHQTYIAT